MDPHRLELTVRPEDLQQVTVVDENDPDSQDRYLVGRVPTEGEVIVLTDGRHLHITGVLWVQTSMEEGEPVRILAPVVMVEETSEE